jgi:hypothetical protein
VSKLGKGGVALAVALTEAFPTMEELEMFADEALDLNINEIPAASLTTLARRLVRWCEKVGREADLFEGARKARPGHANLMVQVAAAERTLTLTGPVGWYREPSNPVEACIIRGRAVLFNRTQLRTHVKELLSVDGRNVLVVHGAKGSGRSHSLEFVVHVRARLETFRTVIVDLEKFPVDVDPRDVVQHMAEELAMPPDPSWPDGQPARVNISLVTAFTRHIDSLDEPVWVIVDGYDHMKAHREVIELFAELAERAEGDRLNLRLMLLGWDEPLRPKLDSVVLHETIDPMDRNVLVEFFTRFLSDQQQPASRAGVGYAVELVEQTAGSDLKGNLHAIAQEAIRIAQTMAEPPRAQ